MLSIALPTTTLLVGRGPPLGQQGSFADLRAWRLGAAAAAASQPVCAKHLVPIIVYYRPREWGATPHSRWPPIHGGRTTDNLGHLLRTSPRSCFAVPRIPGLVRAIGEEESM